jgi:hypothetical protein
MLTLEETAALTQSTVRDIYRHLEAGELHSIATENGFLRVCVNSMGGSTSL